MARGLARAALALALAGGAGGAAAKPWYEPDHAKLQFAGSIGFLSSGPGWAWANRRLEGDVLLGWVPPRYGGEHVVSATGKLTWLPWRVNVAGWELRPATAALQLTYTFGSDYFALLPSHYPSGYYELPTALRAGLALGAAAGRPAWGLRHVGAYAELVAIDVPLALWLRNRRALGPEDVFTLALGARVEF
jgi:hypothetical protein